MQIILSSGSPRRREILSALGVKFEIVSADADESSALTDPKALVRELALRKGRATRELLRERESYRNAFENSAVASFVLYEQQQ